MEDYLINTNVLVRDAYSSIIALLPHGRAHDAHGSSEVTKTRKAKDGSDGEKGDEKKTRIIFVIIINPHAPSTVTTTMLTLFTMKERKSKIIALCNERCIAFLGCNSIDIFCRPRIRPRTWPKSCLELWVMSKLVVP